MKRCNLFMVVLCGGALLCGGVRAEGAGPEDVRLEEVLRQVYAHNPILEASREELKAAQEVYPQALAGWRPTVSAEAGIFATSIESGNSSSGTGATTRDMTVSAQQPVFKSGRTTAETAKARALVMAAQAAADRTQQRVFLEVARAYMDVMRDRTILELRRGSEALLTDELAAARARHKAGEITITDVQHGEGRLARARAEALSARSDLDASNARFEELTGFPSNRVFHYPAAISDIPAQLGDALKTAEENNLDLAAARHARDAAGHGADAILRELFPQIFAYASYNRQYDPQPGIIDKSEVETVGLRATLALYEGGATRSRVRQARHTANKLSIGLSETTHRVRAALKENWTALAAAEAAMSVRIDEISALKNAREGVRAETLMGTRTVLDLLDADQELLESRTALAVARHDAIVAQFAVAENLGLLTPARFGVAKEAFDADAHLKKIANPLAGTGAE